MAYYIGIPLTQDKYAMVDEIDSDLLSERWYANGNGHSLYAKRNVRLAGRVTAVWMHRVILARMLDRPLERYEQVDHINGDGLDNRRANLRLATPSENRCNNRTPKNNTSGYRGVSWAKRTRKWHAQIKVNGRQQYLGYFASPIDAARVYNRAARELHGDFARLNEGVD